MALLFEQQPNETTKAFSAFKLYLDMGDKKSIRDLARTHRRSVATLMLWSRKWRWPARVKAKAAHDEALQREAEARAADKNAQKWAARQKQLKEDEWDLAEQLIAKARTMLQSPLYKQRVKDGQTIVVPADWRIADATRMVDVAAKLKRLSSGLATDRQEISGPAGAPVPVSVTIDLTKLSSAELEALEKIAIKASEAAA